MHANELPVTSMTLPKALSAAVSAWLEREGLGGRRLSAAANTAIYRDGGTSARIDLSAYLVARLPATHAAVTKVLGELASRRPGFSPTSLLDVGAGPGTASWAAAAQWPGIESVTFLDTDRRFLKLAGDLAASGPPALAAARSLTGTIEAMPVGLSAELVVAAYTLAELPLPAWPRRRKLCGGRRSPRWWWWSPGRLRASPDWRLCGKPCCGQGPWPWRLAPTREPAR